MIPANLNSHKETIRNADGILVIRTEVMTATGIRRATRADLREVGTTIAEIRATATPALLTEEIATAPPAIRAAAATPAVEAVEVAQAETIIEQISFFEN